MSRVILSRMAQRTLVDSALERAQLETKTPNSNYDFRIDDALKKDAIKVCERHGITLAAFFRATAAELVREYGE